MTRKTEMIKEHGSTASLATCDMCEKQAVSEIYQEQEFLYGSGADQVAIRVRVPVMTCSSCGMEYTDERAEDIRHDAVCDHLGRLKPLEIRQIRKSYDKNQDEWAKLTGFGSASIKRWESGSQIQNESADKYMRLLAIPEVFERLQSGETSGRPKVREHRFRNPPTQQALKRAPGFKLRPPGRENRMAA